MTAGQQMVLSYEEIVLQSWNRGGLITQILACNKYFSTGHIIIITMLLPENIRR
jgi:hypothetical protein